MGHDLDPKASPQSSEPILPATPSTNAIPPFLAASQQKSAQETEDETTPPSLVLEGSGPLPVPVENAERSVAFDEAAALRSLDDTIMRPGPNPETIWAEEERWVRDNEPKAPRFHLPTAALVAAVGVVAFVAGGVTARLSSQMPVLLEQKPAITETKAEYHEVSPVNQEGSDTLTKPAPQTTAPEEPVEETPDKKDDPADGQESDRHRYSYPTPQAPTDDGQTTTDGQAPDDEPTISDDTHSYHWDFGSEGDRSLSYDTDDDKVTLDYDGYTFSFDLDDLLNEDGLNEEGYGTQTTDDPYDSGRTDPTGPSDEGTTYYDPWQWLAPTDDTTNGTTDQQTTDGYTTYRFYDYGTDDDTDQNRDTMTWNDRSDSMSWGGGLHT